MKVKGNIYTVISQSGNVIVTIERLRNTRSGHPNYHCTVTFNCNDFKFGRVKCAYSVNIVSYGSLVMVADEAIKKVSNSGLALMSM